MKRVMALSETMLEAAQEQDWDRLNTLTAQRQPLLEQVFADARRRMSPDALQRCILRLLEIDKRIIQLGQQSQRQMLEKLSDFGRGRKAKQAYAAQNLSR